MTVCCFVYFEAPDNLEIRISDEDLDRVVTTVRTLPDIRRGLVFTPVAATVEHPFSNDGTPPVLALQLYFDTLPALEAVLRPGGALTPIVGPEALPSLADCAVSHQVTMVRPFPVDEPTVAPPAGERPCSYLVHYPGAAENFDAWLAHYVDHHPQIMRDFPGVREIEIYTRVDWCSLLPWAKVEHMQRNKLMFDSPAALAAALASPTILRMRADFHTFPPFSGGNRHYPMTTREVVARPVS